VRGADIACTAFSPANIFGQIFFVVAMTLTLAIRRVPNPRRALALHANVNEVGRTDEFTPGPLPTAHSCGGQIRSAHRVGAT
jgi:hypothetical protein